MGNLSGGFLSFCASISSGERGRLKPWKRRFVDSLIVVVSSFRFHAEEAVTITSAIIHLQHAWNRKNEGAFAFPSPIWYSSADSLCSLVSFNIFVRCARFTHQSSATCTKNVCTYKLVLHTRTVTDKVCDDTRICQTIVASFII